jgi:hypothetical protein
MEVTAYDSVADMMDAIHSAREKADEQVRPSQAAAKVGDFFVKFFPPEQVIIFGEVLDPVESDRQAGADEDELNYLRKLYAEPHMKHFRFSRCFSVMCPEGELGDTHVSSILCVIPKEVFEKAREKNWSSDPEDVREVLGDLVDDILRNMS